MRFATASLLALGLALSSTAAAKAQDVNPDRVLEFIEIMAWNDCRLTPDAAKRDLPANGFNDRDEREAIVKALKKDGRLTKDGRDLVYAGPECASEADVKSALGAALAKQDCKLARDGFKPLLAELNIDPKNAQDAIQAMLQAGEATVDADNTLVLSAEVCG